MSVVEPATGGVPSKVGVAIARFNAVITRPLAEGAIEVFERSGVETIVRVEVAGALELPLAALRLFESGCEGVVAVGAVIKGETDHYRIVADESARGLGNVALQFGRPVGNAVLTVKKFEQAVERSLPGPANKGREAAEAVLEAHKNLESI